MTFSGQVATHTPHCTHAASVKLSCGRSGWSDRALAGQALTHDRQSVQPSTSMWTRPYGAPFGNGITVAGWGANSFRVARAVRATSRLLPAVEKKRGVSSAKAGSS